MLPKYRAWHKKQKLMFAVHAISFEPFTGEIDDIRLYLGKLAELVDYKASYVKSPVHFQGDISQLILMQSTGLFFPAHPSRKKMLEVFEDDICEFIRVDTGAKLKDKVMLSHGMFHFSNWAIPVYDARFKNIKVIGSIHANPELLEAKP